MAYDAELFYLLNNLSGKSEFFDWIIIFAAEYLGWFAVAAFLVVLFFSLFSKSEKLKIFLTAAVSVVLSRFIITEIIRFLYCRPRPFMAYAVKQLVNENHCSFPSGHAAFFFALAMVVVPASPSSQWMCVCRSEMMREHSCNQGRIEP